MRKQFQSLVNQHPQRNALGYRPAFFCGLVLTPVDARWSNSLCRFQLVCNSGCPVLCSADLSPHQDSLWLLALEEAFATQVSLGIKWQSMLFLSSGVSQVSLPQFQSKSANSFTRLSVHCRTMQLKLYHLTLICLLPSSCWDRLPPVWPWIGMSGMVNGWMNYNILFF